MQYFQFVAGVFKIIFVKKVVYDVQLKLFNDIVGEKDVL